jgi:hypothetical protein
MVILDDNDIATNALVSRFLADHPRVAAEKLEKLDRGETAEILAELPAEQMVTVWEVLSPNLATDLLLLLPPERRNELAKRADTGKLAVILSRMEETARQEFDGLSARYCGPTHGHPNYYIQGRSDCRGSVKDPPPPPPETGDCRTEDRRQ